MRQYIVTAWIQILFCERSEKKDIEYSKESRENRKIISSVFLTFGLTLQEGCGQL